MTLRLLCLLLLGAPLAAQPAQAQDTQQASEAEEERLAARFQLADSYLRVGQFERAITLLEDLYAERPGTYIFFDKLKEAYESVKRYDDAIGLVDQRLEGGQDTPALRSERARLLYQKGDEGAAFSAWDAAVAASPQTRSTYQVVYRSLYEVREFDRAIGTLLEGREALADPTAFGTELAVLYSLSGQHEQAMDEYVRLLNQTPEQVGYVRSRLARYAQQPEAVETSIRVLERAVRAEPLNRALRELLAWLYVEQEDYPRALDANRAIDRLEDEQGLVLFRFAEHAAEAGAYDVASEAYGEIVSRYPDAPSAAEARFGLARMEERWAEAEGESAFDTAGNRVPAPHYDAALDAYRTFLQEHPSHPYYAEALFRIGRLQQDVLRDLGAAEGTFQDVAARYPNTQAADGAAFHLGEIALRRDRLEDARLQFNRLVERLRTGELAERARYAVARVHFYRGEFEAAQTLAEVQGGRADTDAANDAIELKVLMLENKGPDSLNVPLRTYARARLRYEQRRPDAALATLDSLLAQHAQHPLADDARFLRAQALHQAGRSQEAYQAFIELPLLHPTSFLADRALFQAAEALEGPLEDPTRALETYAKLLSDYPGSLLVTEARARIRRLRGDPAS